MEIALRGKEICRLVRILGLAKKQNFQGFSSKVKRKHFFPEQQLEIS
jgi:hypothetical protein